MIKCSCNHLSIFSVRKFVDSAAVDSNIGAVYDIDNLESLQVEHSTAVLICLGIIYGLFTPLMILFCKWDTRDEFIRNGVFERIHNLKMKLSKMLRFMSTNDPSPEAIENNDDEH